MRCRRWISLGLILCVSIPALAAAEEWSPLAHEAQWTYVITGVSKVAIAGTQQSQHVRGTRTVEVRDVSVAHPESPYELVDTRVTRSEGEAGEKREIIRMWLRKDRAAGYQYDEKQSRQTGSSAFDASRRGRTASAHNNLRNRRVPRLCLQDTTLLGRLFRRSGPARYKTAEALAAYATAAVPSSTRNQIVGVEHLDDVAGHGGVTRGVRMAVRNAVGLTFPGRDPGVEQQVVIHQRNSVD